ncbi:MAG: hypothetical protein U0X87_14700 [Anaerolineales bacterium]
MARRGVNSSGRADSSCVQRRLCLGERHLALSSWRYNLPVDWIVYFYFGIGAIEILVWVASLFGAKVSNPKAQVLDAVQLRQERKSNYAILVAAFVLIGSLPWLAERIAQPRYTSTPEELKSQVILQDPRVEEFLSQPDALILEGRLLYRASSAATMGYFPPPAHQAIYTVRDFRGSDSSC